MSAVDEAARCIKEMNGVVCFPFYCYICSECLTRCNVGIERKAHPCRLFCDG
jgi:hypothetical protein